MAISKDTSLKMLRWFKEALNENIDSKIVTLSGGGGEVNRINNISIDGRIQSIDASKTAQLDLSAYAKKTDVTTAVSTISGGTTIISGASYTLQPATKTKLGGVIVGGGLGVNSTGTLRVTISGGQSNVIESISIDGTPQTVTDKTVQLNLSNYAKQADLTSAVKSIQTLNNRIEHASDGRINVIEKISLDDTIQPVVGKTATLGLSAYAKKSDLAGGIRMKGSVTSSKLPTETALVGDMYNVTNNYTNSDGTPIKAGTNVVYTADGKWDAMTGYVDTSNLVQKVTGKQLSSNDFTDEEKTKLQGLKNYTLPRANATLLGGVMVGAGLSMTGDSLNATICNVFEGATSIKGGDVGLVTAPATGEQLKFLCSDGTWRIPPSENINIFACGYTPDAMAVDVLSYSSDVMTLDALSSPTNTQGTLYMGIAQDECCLKLFSDDKEYTFNPDVFDIAKVKPPLPADFVLGQIYYLNTAPSAANGTLWYTTNDKGLTTLCAHREDADYTFNFGFNVDLVTSEILYSYLTFKSSTQDLMGCTWTTSITEPVIEETDFGIRALRNLDKSLADTVATSSGWKHTFPEKNTVLTIDFWLSWNEDTSEGEPAKVGSGTARHGILTINGSAGLVLQIAEDNKNLISYDYDSNDNTPIAGFESVFENKSSQRLHIAMTHKSGEGVKIYINGKYERTNGNTRSVKSVTIFPLMVGTETGYRGLYIDHFRIRNEVVWTEDFPPPQEDDYIIW